MNAKRRLVVVGNGMAGARLVEEVLARRPRRLPDHVRRRAVRQQPHPALERARAKLIEEHLHQPAAVVEANGVTSTPACAPAVDRAAKQFSASAARPGVQPRHRHRQQAVHPPIDGVTSGPPPKRGNGAASFKRGIVFKRSPTAIV
jgi:hypothetical protein